MLIHERAELIATVAHGATGQKRKYTGDPYIVHPRAVVALLVEHVPSAYEHVLATAWLHDVLEDTKLNPSIIEMNCGYDVLEGIILLTNCDQSFGNRAARNEVNKARVASAPGWVQTVKVADLIDNTRSIVQYDPDFAKVYMREKAELLSVLSRADPALLQMANEIVNNYFIGKDYYKEI